MKKIALLLSVIILVVTGCRMTPEEPVVMSKRDEAFENMVLEEVKDANYDFPEHYKDNFKGKDKSIDIIIDANVIVPNVSAFPVVKVQPMEITQKITRQAADVFMEGRCGYYPSLILTKDRLIEKILTNKALIADRDELVEYYDGDEEWADYCIENGKLRIEELQKEIEDAPVEVQQTSTEFVFHPYEFYMEVGWQEKTKQSDEAQPTPIPSPEVLDHRVNQYLIAEDYLSDGMYSRFRVSNEYGFSEIDLRSSNCSQIQFFKCHSFMATSNQFDRSPFNFGSDDGDIGTGFTEIKYSKEEAKAMADKALADMGITGYFLESCRMDRAIGPFSEINKPYDEWEKRPHTFYLFVYRPQVSGVPILRANTDCGADTDRYRKILLYEKVIVRVANEGVVEFTWTNPMDRSKVINKNVKLISFDKVVKQAKKFMQITYNKMTYAYITKEYDEWEEQLEEVEGGFLQVNSIRLGIARIPIYNKVGEYMMIPVWNFYGAHEIIRKDSERWSDEDRNYANQMLLTINAIDGSVIRERYSDNY